MICHASSTPPALCVDGRRGGAGRRRGAMGPAASRCRDSLLRSRAAVYLTEAAASPWLLPLRLAGALVISAALTVRAARLYLRCAASPVLGQATEADSLACPALPTVSPAFGALMLGCKMLRLASQSWESATGDCTRAAAGALCSLVPLTEHWCRLCSSADARLDSLRLSLSLQATRTMPCVSPVLPGERGALCGALSGALTPPAPLPRAAAHTLARARQVGLGGGRVGGAAGASGGALGRGPRAGRRRGCLGGGHVPAAAAPAAGRAQHGPPLGRARVRRCAPNRAPVGRPPDCRRSACTAWSGPAAAAANERALRVYSLRPRHRHASVPPAAPAHPADGEYAGAASLRRASSCARVLAPRARFCGSAGATRAGGPAQLRGVAQRRAGARQARTARTRWRRWRTWRRATARAPRPASRTSSAMCTCRARPRAPPRAPCAAGRASQAGPWWRRRRCVPAAHMAVTEPASALTQHRAVQPTSRHPRRWRMRPPGRGLCPPKRRGRPQPRALCPRGAGDSGDRTIMGAGSAPYPDLSGAQETADGVLVVLHDLPSLLAASLGEGANRAAAAALRAAGVNAATARVQVQHSDRRAGDTPAWPYGRQHPGREAGM